jgi:hypothetical protein
MFVFNIKQSNKDHVRNTCFVVYYQIDEKFKFCILLIKFIKMCDNSDNYPLKNNIYANFKQRIKA